MRAAKVLTFQSVWFKNGVMNNFSCYKIQPDWNALPLKMTEGMKEFVLSLLQHELSNGYPATTRDIINSSNITSTSVVNFYKRKLVSAKLVEYRPDVSRSMRLSPKALEKIFRMKRGGLQPIKSKARNN